MDLIDRYLQAVRGFLPKRDQDDIIKELAEDIRSQIDDRESAAGRPLTKHEVEEFLKQMGHPMVLAARFQPRRHLVGPTIFPFYQRTLLIALGVALIVNVVVAAALVASGRPAKEIMDAILRFPTTTAATVFGWVTLVFAVGEWGLGHTKLLVAWEPGALPPVRRDGPRVSRPQALGELVMGVVGLVYLLLLPRHPWLLFGPAALFLELAPIWSRYYIPAVALVTLSLVAPIVNLFRPDWTGLRVVSRVGMGLVWLVFLSLLIDAGPYLVAKDAGGNDEYRKLVDMLNTLVRISFVVSWLITAADVLREGWRYWRTHRGAATPA